MRIVVSGGSGFLGRALVARLRTEHDVTVLTRRPRAAGDVLWSADDGPGPWREAVAASDAVINLGGEPIAAGRWTRARKAAIRGSRVRATAALVGAVRAAAQPPVLLSASAIGFYGARGDEPLTEDSPAGSDFLAMVCREWEAAAQQAADRTRVVLLRSGLVLAAEGGALPRIAWPFHFLAGGRLGSGRQYWSWIHRDDWVEMVRWAVAAPTVSGPVNLTAPEPVTNAEFVRALGAALHRPAVLPAPAFALRIALGEMANAMILSGQRVLPAKAQTNGFTFRYPTLRPALESIYRRA
jgi:uncharacterized protein (TIGR01777 family)